MGTPVLHGITQLKTTAIGIHTSHAEQIVRCDKHESMLDIICLSLARQLLHITVSNSLFIHGNSTHGELIKKELKSSVSFSSA